MKRHEVFFGLHLDLHPTIEDVCLGADVTPENIEKLLDRVKPDHVAYDCKGHEGYTGYPTKVGAASPGIVKDSLKIWREVTKKKGVLLGIHYSGVVDTKATVDFPEWQALKKDGTSDNWATGTFSEYADKRMIPQLKEIIELYDVDSVWLDGECWGAQLDYSENAVKAWKEKTNGQEPPTERDHPLWNEWKSFHRESFISYIKNWTGEIHKMGVEAASNWLHTTFCPIPPMGAVDFISGDFDPNCSVDRARFEVRYLCHMGMPWELQSWGFDASQGYALGGSEEQKLPTQLMQEASVVLTHGGAYELYYLPTRSGYINDNIIETAGEVADFARARQSLCHKNTYIPQVCILYSEETYSDRSDNVYTWWDCRVKELEGALHLFLELNYSVDVLSEFMLTEKKIAEFPLVVIPDCYKLTDDFKKILKGYVENGGNLLILGSGATKLFESELGVKFIGQPTEQNAVITEGAVKMPVPGVFAEINPVDSEVIAYKYTGVGKQNRSSYMDTRDEGVSKEHAKNVTKAPAVTLRRLGKGKIMGVYGDISLNFYNSHHPHLRKIMGNIIKKLWAEPMFTSDAPFCVDFALRKSAAGSLTLHLTNMSNLPVSPQRAFCDFVPEINNITVNIKLSECPKSVKWQPDGTELNYKYENNLLTLKIASLQIHGAIEITG